MAQSQLIPFARHSYTLDSLPASAQRLVNLYVEAAPPDAVTQAVVRPVPGLTFVESVGAGPIRGLNSTVPGLIYIVSGVNAYRQVSDLSAPPVFIGNVGGSGPVTIAVSATQVCICANPSVYVAEHSGGLRLVTNVTAGRVVSLDGYFIFTDPGAAGTFRTSRLLNAETVDPLDVATLSTAPNIIHGVAVVSGQVVFIGPLAIEAWYDSGDAAFPFARVQSGVVTPGCIASWGYTVADGSLWWLGTDGSIYRSRGYNAQRVSTHAIERIILTQPNLRGSLAFSYVSQGHTFVAFQFYAVGLSQTIVYDCSTGLWHERTSAVGGPWRVEQTCQSQYDGSWFAGDADNGNIYRLNSKGGTDNGVALPRSATLPPLAAHGPRQFMTRLEIEMETGPGGPGSISLDWSDDGGRTFGTPRTIPTDGASGYHTRVTTTRLGSFRHRTLRVSCTGDATFFGAVADLEPGNS